MFDLPISVHAPKRSTGFLPQFPTDTHDLSQPFALTMSNQNLSAAMSGEAQPLVIDRFATLAEAMLGVIAHAEEVKPAASPHMLAILDRADRLVLAGAAADGVVAWCHPVSTAAEARAVVTEASQLRAQALRAADWQEPELAGRLRHRADLLEARLVDPLWRAFAACALRIAA